MHSQTHFLHPLCATIVMVSCTPIKLFLNKAMGYCFIVNQTIFIVNQTINDLPAFCSMLQLPSLENNLKRNLSSHCDIFRIEICFFIIFLLNKNS